MHFLTQHKSIFWETIVGFGKGSSNYQKGVGGGLQTESNQEESARIESEEKALLVGDCQTTPFCCCG